MSRGTVNSKGQVWDPVLLTWVAETQPGGSGGGGGAATIADGADVAQGTTGDAAWTSGAGTVIGLLKKIASAGGSAVSVADGSDVAEGTTTDAAVVSDANGTLSAKLRGLVKIFASVWDSVNGRLKVDGSAVTQPVSAASLPLPTGAATETTLADIATKVPALGQALSVASTPVVLASDQSAVPVTPPYPTGAGVSTGALRVVPATFSSMAVTQSTPAAAQSQAWLTKLTDGTNLATVKAASTPAAAVDTALVIRSIQLPAALGQTTMAASSPVTLASDQTTLPVSAASLPLPTGAATSALQSTGNASVASIDSVQGTTADSAWVSGAGTVIALLKKIASAGGSAVSVADGADAAEGTTTDAAVVTDVAGTISGKLRGLVKIFASVWDSANGRLKVDASAVTVPVSGTVTTTPPANASTNVAQFGGTNASTGTGASGAGIPRVTVANDSNVLVTPPTLTKGTQGSTGLSVQELKDAGRNQTNYFMAAPVACTTAEVMQSLTGYKGGIAVAATVSPAVVTSGKTYRIDKIKVTIIALTAIGSARINLRANLSGAGVVGSPLVMSYQVGIPAIFTAGSAETYSFDYSEGMEFPAGTGLAIGVIGEGADGTTGTAVAKVMVSLHGFEY